MNKVFKRKLAAVGSLVALAITSSAVGPASAATAGNKLVCHSTLYACQTWGYTGSDFYGYWHFSNVGASGSLHNCTSYAAYMVWLTSPYDSRWASLGSADLWASRARAYGLTVGSVPHVGDIAQWNFGHVAYVENVTKNSAGQVVSIEITDDNFNLLETTDKILYPGQTQYLPFPDNFITFPAQGGGGGRGPIAMSPVTAP